MVKMKVTALVMVSKNLATVELPTTYRGILPSLINVPVTNGPQPPPAKESIKPPTNPNTLRLVLRLVLPCPVFYL